MLFLLGLTMLIQLCRCELTGSARTIAEIEIDVSRKSIQRSLPTVKSLSDKSISSRQVVSIKGDKSMTSRISKSLSFRKPAKSFNTEGAKSLSSLGVDEGPVGVKRERARIHLMPASRRPTSNPYESIEGDYDAYC